MSKEAKRVIYFLGVICLFVSIVGMLGGCECKAEGVQGLIYHDGVLIAKTNCDFDLQFEMNTENVIVESITREYSSRVTREKYQYANDGQYRVERKACKF